MLLKTGFFMLCVSLALAADDSVSLPPPGPFTIVPPNGTTSSPSPPITTIAPTSSTTTTVKPTTASSTTPKPTTASTTSKSTTASTTPKPTTASTTTKPTTSLTTTSTAKPTPSPKPDDKPTVNNYNGTYSGTNTTCLLVDMAVRLEVLKDNNSILIDIPQSPNYTVTCPEPNHEYLTIYWSNNNSDSVNFAFFKNNSKYEIQSINSTLLLSGANTSTRFYHIKPEFSVSDDVSYYCGRDQPLNMTDGINNVTVAKVHLIKLKYQAFMNSTDGKYSTVWNCDGANTSDVVPVVVGCVLAVLVVLVLVAYLFGRRRCQARGYLSMFAQDKNESDYIPMKTLSCFN